VRRFLILCVTALSLGLSATAEETAKIVINLREAGPEFPRTLHGIFFEDINYGADGGLYAELIQNRSFEHGEKLYGWKPLVGKEQINLDVRDESPLNENNTHYLTVKVLVDNERVGISNAGFDRIAVKKDDKYNSSLFVRTNVPNAVFRAVLLDKNYKPIAEAELPAKGNGWQKLSATLTPSESADEVRLAVLFDKKGEYHIDMVSLFPQRTFAGRANGLRSDITQLLAEMKPGFLRFPGGCIVEGRELDNAYRWKDTIGELHERKQNWNLWSNRESPQYHQTYGLGFFEFFQLCDDIGAEPVPIVNCGMACQARRGKPAPLDELQPWIDDAIDLIEFANGSVTSTWGAKRAAMGHPEPFNMKYLGVGNEQWNEEYFERYVVFEQALREKYPDIKLISTSGPHPSGDLWDYAWQKFRTGTPTDIVDEHYYRSPAWFFENDHRYDSYDRRGPKVFAGEFAAHGRSRKNNLEAALAEAAFMTGLWRNADIVEMACYAPLFARIGHTQWVPDLIWFDHQGVFGSPSYYVQKMYANHLPEQMLKTSVEAPEMKPEPFTGSIGLGTWKTQAEFKDIKVTKNGKTLYEFDPAKGLDDWRKPAGEWSVVDGVIRQTDEGETPRLFIGEDDWTDYTLSLKAKKTGGDEGFLISFAQEDRGSPTLFNIGGWNNTDHAIEIRGSVETRVQGKVETDRWYDIRIELQGASVKCYLDDKLILESSTNPHPTLYAASGFNPSTGEVVLAVTNPSGEPITTTIESQGKQFAPGDGYAEVLSAESDQAENSLSEPTKVSPREESVEVTDGDFKHNFPPYSLTILKLKAK
jgi:alpha-L-arabinofuranosidase